MQLEYFQLIGRILDLNIDAKTIKVEAQVPQHNTIFEGHFPGYPIMPGVLLIESMAQTSGWLLLALLKFERMPLLAAVKEAKMRGFVSAGEVLTIDANVLHEGSGYAMTQAKVRVGGKLRCNATITFSHIPFPNPDLRGHMDAVAKRVGFPSQAILSLCNLAVLRRSRRKSGSPESALPLRSAKGSMPIGMRSMRIASTSMRRALA